MNNPAGPPFTRRGIRAGFLRGQPFALGVFVYGLAFGLVADQAGLAAWQAVLMSAVVYSGSAQLAAIGVISATLGGPMATTWALFLTLLVINARYVLYSATLQPWLHGLSASRAYPTLFFLGDGSWLMSMRAREAGETDAGFVFGSSVAMYLPWVLGTLIGTYGGTLALNPRALGVDFLFAGFAAAMLAGMLRNRMDLSAAAVAAASALVAAKAGAPGWAPLLAGLAAGLFAFLRFRPAGGTEERA